MPRVDMTSKSERDERNRKTIEQFRNNRGLVQGSSTSAPILLLTTIGARSGQRRINPLMYLPDGDRWVVFASKAGAPSHPDWYHNLVANPTVVVEVGAATLEATASVLPEGERDRLYARQAELYPVFAEHQQKTTRRIPAVALTRNA